jgi:signal transduction histidine kinase
MAFSPASDPEKRIPNRMFAPQQSSQALMGEFQETAPSGQAAFSFPYRSNTWRLEQPSSRDTEERLAVATIATDIGIWDLDMPSGSFQWCYRCAKMFGAPFEPGLWQEHVLERIHPDDRQRVQTSIEVAVHPGGTGVFDCEFRIKRPDGETRWLASNGKVFFENIAGTRTAIRFLGTLLDRTEQKLIHDALVESEKLAVTGRLAVSIAHEIKNPLDAVTNLLYILRDEPSAEKRSEYLTLAETELARLDDIASNTLRFYRDPVSLITLDLAQLIESVLVLFRGRTSLQQVRVQTELPVAVAVQAPEGELRQVLVNLISNALDAMPKGGRLIVRARELTGKDGHSCVRLTVADNGVGMSREILSRIFEAFYTTKKVAGTGIGLWLSQEIIKKCGSKIHVKSTVGRGTAFSLYLAGANSPEAAAFHNLPVPPG